MKKALKIVGIIILILVIGIFVLVKCIGNLPSAPTDYQKTVQTGGEIEAKYMVSGAYEVSAYEETVLQGFERYILYYPDELAESCDTYPVIVLCNGSGTPLSKYPTVAEHFASWGFIVIGTEEQYDWNGFAAEMCIRYLELLNANETVNERENIFFGNDWNGFAAEMCIRYLELLNANETVNERENIFFGKIDFENMGIVGHSQGGAGVINAITTQQHSDIFKTAVSLSPTNKELAHNLLWDYDATKVNIPIMLISGAGGGDDWVVTGEQLEAIYDDISSAKVMLRRVDTSHGEMLYSANGYVTAWFMWQLQGDTEAGQAFNGSDAEILKNILYQDQKLDISE